MSLEYDLKIADTLSMTKVYAESIVAQARSYFTEDAPETLTAQDPAYLRDCISHMQDNLVNITLPDQVNDMLTGATSPRLCGKMQMEPLWKNNTTFYPMYVRDYMHAYETEMSNLLNIINTNQDKEGDDETIQEAAGRCSGMHERFNACMLNSVRHIPEEDSAYRVREMIPYGDTYLTKDVSQWVNGFDETKSYLLKALEDVNTVVDGYLESCGEQDAIVRAMHKSNMKPVLIQVFMGECNGYRYRMLNLIKHVLGHIAKRTDDLNHNTKIVCKICDAVKSYEGNPHYGKVVQEAISMMNLMPEESDELGGCLTQVNIGPWEIVATRCLEFHKPILEKLRPASNDEPLVDYLDTIGNEVYDHEPYNNLLEIMTLMNASIDKVAAALADPMVVIDELVERSDLITGADTKYKERVQMVDDVHKIESAANGSWMEDLSPNLYVSVIKEIGDFPENVKTIAEAVSETKEKINFVIDQMQSNVNSDFSNSQTIEEMMKFMEGTADQFRTLTNQMGIKLMLRLKKLTLCAENICVKLEDKCSDPFGITEEASVDYTELFDELYLEYVQALQDICASELSEAFQECALQKSMGMTYYEVTEGETNGQNNGSNTNTTQNQPTQNNATQATQTAEQKKSIGERIQDLKNKIKEAFDSMMTKFKENMKKASVRTGGNDAVSYKDWIAQNKDALLNRSYVNVSLDIVPYEDNMPWDSLLAEVRKFNQNLGSIQPSDLGNLSKPSLIFGKLFAYAGVTIDNAEAPLGDCKKKAADQLTKYYKVGRGNLATKKYADGALKSLMEKAVNFCDNYYKDGGGSGEDQLMTEINNVKTTLDTMTSHFITESVDMIMSYVYQIYQEADGDQGQGGENKPNLTPKVDDNSNANNGNGNNNTGAITTTQMMETLEAASMVYCGSVLNAVRDRINDYYKAMQALVPADSGQTQQEQQDQNQQNQNQNQENPNQNQNQQQ